LIDAIAACFAAVAQGVNEQLGASDTPHAKGEASSRSTGARFEEVEHDFTGKDLNIGRSCGRE
jgi:hypothetical protein